MVDVPAAMLYEMETRLRTTLPTPYDRELFRNCYRLVRSYAMQNVHVFGGFALARALRCILVLRNRHPMAFTVQVCMLTLAETALPAAFATGMDATSLCDAWTFVAAMWAKKPSPRLKESLVLAFQRIPMQAIHETHLASLLESMGTVGPPWPSPFLDMVEELCVLRLSHMDNGVFGLIVQYVGEVVATTEWEPALLAFLIGTRESLARASWMDLATMQRVTVGLLHLKPLLTGFDMSPVIARMDSRRMHLTASLTANLTLAESPNDYINGAMW